MPKGHSGIKRTSTTPSFIDTKKYEKPTEYTSTSSYSEEYVKDPKGMYVHAETHEKYSLVEHYAENLGYKAVRSAPVGSIIEIDVPSTSWTRGIGEVPAHKEYFEVIQDTKTAKALRLRETTDKRGYFFNSYGIDRITNTFIFEKEGGQYAGRLDTVKDIQRRLKFVEKISIYRPKGEK